MRGGWVYVMANRPFGSLYVGVANHIARRCWEHRQGLSEGFTKRQREKNIKHWPRAWKTRLIGQGNAEWRDLYAEIA
jgi:putative endonuclease